MNNKSENNSKLAPSCEGLQRMSFIFAFMFEVFPIEADILHVFVSEGILFPFALIKLMFLIVIYLPIAVCVCRFGRFRAGKYAWLTCFITILSLTLNIGTWRNILSVRKQSTNSVSDNKHDRSDDSRLQFLEKFKNLPTNALSEQIVSAEFLGKSFAPASHSECTLSMNNASDVNQEMDRELEAAEIPEDFGKRMESMFRDKRVDEMVRNFAVQHLERFAQERTIRGTWDVDSDEAAKVRAALEDAALEVDNSIGGTAMLALARLSEIDPHVDRRRLSSRSASLVANPSARLSTRIAAAQLCGLLRVRSALPALRALSSDPATPTPLRLAARHAAEAAVGR